MGQTEWCLVTCQGLTHSGAPGHSPHLALCSADGRPAPHLPQPRSEPWAAGSPLKAGSGWFSPSSSGRGQLSHHLTEAGCCDVSSRWEHPSAQRSLWHLQEREVAGQPLGAHGPGRRQGVLRAPGLLQPVLQSTPSHPGPQARWAEQADIRSGSICRTQFRKVTLSKASLQSAALNRSAILENSAVATGLEKVSFHSNPKERPCQGCSNYCTVPFPSHASKVMLRILQLRLHQYVNRELPDVQAGF